MLKTISKRIVAAAALLGVFVAIAAAITIDPTKTISARQFATQQTHYWRATINFNDANIAAGVQYGTLPQNAQVTDVQCDIITVFNAATTNVLTIGTTLANANEIVNAADLNEAATGTTKITRGLGRALYSAADTGLFAKYTQSGTAATTGQATCTVLYTAPNDQ